MSDKLNNPNKGKTKNLKHGKEEVVITTGTTTSSDIQERLGTDKTLSKNMVNWTILDGINKMPVLRNKIICARFKILKQQ